MKKCSKCSAVYSDKTLNFCLTDGNELEEDISKDNTLEMSEETTQSINPSNVRVIKRVMQRSVDDTKWEIEYPQIQGLTTSYIQSRINNFLRKKFFKEFFESEIEASFGIDEENPIRDEAIEISYEIYLLTDYFISLKRDYFQESKNQAHPNTYYDSFNIDLTSGYDYTYQDLFKADSNFKTLILEIVELKLEEEFIKEEKKDEFEFVLCEGHLQFFNLYDAHVLRHETLEIKYTEIFEMIHQESCLGRLLNGK